MAREPHEPDHVERRTPVVPPPPGTAGGRELLERACRHFRLRARGDLDLLVEGQAEPPGSNEHH